MSGLILVYTLCSDLTEAESIVQALLERKLIACANIGSPVVSHYVWEGKAERSGEIPVILKTTADQYPAVEKAVVEMHSYDVPFVAMWPAAETHAAYLDWARAAVISK